MAKTYPNTLYVLVTGNNPLTFQGRTRKEYLPIGEEKVLIAEYKLVRQVEVRREVVEQCEVG